MGEKVRLADQPRSALSSRLAKVRSTSTHTHLPYACAVRAKTSLTKEINGPGHSGWNHSGKLGPIGFLQSAMGLANAQRALDYLAALAEFCTRDGVRQVVGMLSVANEVPVLQVGQVAVKSL